jgi:hypothetical protein
MERPFVSTCEVCYKKKPVEHVIAGMDPDDGMWWLCVECHRAWIDWLTYVMQCRKA